MADFVQIPIVSSYNVEYTDSGMPFSQDALAIQQGSFMYRGVYVGVMSGTAYIARVGDKAYAMSVAPARCYVWLAGNNFTAPYDTSALSDDICSVFISTIKSWSVDLTNFNSFDEMTERFYATYIFPNPPSVSDIAIVIAASIGAGNDIEFKVTGYISGADFINLNINAGTVDPNDSGGTSSVSFPEGTFDDTSDSIPIPAMPNISAANSGLVTLFKPTLEELHDLGAYLWTNLTDFIENLNKIFVNPMDYMIALNILPCSPSVGTSRSIKIGSFTTTINMSPVISQWYEFDCGTVNLPLYWGSALDYAPYTKVSLFLPFIGAVTLNTDEVMGRELSVKYRIDLLSGQCVAMVLVSGLVNQTEAVMYQYTGECSVSVPLTGSDWSRIYSAAIGAVGTAITGGVAAGAAGVAAGGATAALAGAQAADAASNAGLAYAMINDTSKGVPGVQQMRADMARASQMALDAGRQAASAPASVANGVRAMRIANTVNNTAQQVISGKGSVSHTGTVSASAGMLGVKTPYVLIEYPNQSLADNYKHFVGYPSNMYARLGDLSGYTECEQVIPNGLVNQTDMEMAEILEALKGGVYL